MKYIDAERLRAEIEHLSCIQRTIGDRAINSSMRRFYEGTEDMCNQILLHFGDNNENEERYIVQRRIISGTEPGKVVVEVEWIDR